MEKGNTSQKKMKPSKKKKTKRFYCILCRSYYVKCAAQEHVHGMLHHRELETVLGKDLCHDCHACWISVVGLNEFAQHISTAQHKANLQALVSGRVKTFSLSQTLSAEAMTKIQERNKTIKKEVKKAMKKQKKKLKQKAGRKQTTRETTEKSKQVNLNAPMQDTYQREGTVALVKNKENKDFSLQRQLHETESFFQNQSGFYHFSGGSSGRTWHQPYAQEQFTQSSSHTKYDDNLSVNNQSIGMKTKHSQRKLNKSYAMPRDTTWPPFRKYNYYNTESSSAGDKDFTSDHLPQNGAIVFDRGQNASSGCSQAEREGSHCSANPALANRPDTTAPIRDVDVGVTLRQIRRALGVREPSKADREAKRPNKVAGTDKGPSSGASGASVQYPQDNYPSSSAHSSIAPTKTKQTTVRTTEERSQHCQKSLAVANGLARSSETQGPHDWPVAVRQHMCEATPSEPNLNKSQRVRIAHKPGRAQEATHKPTLNKLYSLSGATSKLSWSEMYEGMKRRKHNSVKNTRFGTEPSNPPNSQETSTQQDTYMPLSEGFHWESFPHIPSNSHPTLPPPPQDPPNLGSRREEHSTSPPHEPLEQPKTAQQDGTGCKVTAVSVKVEPNFEIDNKSSNKDSASKRKHKAVTDEDISDKEPSGKRKKTKSKKGYHQMDQLLAVSLREEELSHSLQDLDKSLVQARTSLQAAYAEVQRLLLLRQQFISEVNSLRVKRIEILQGIQEGYSGTYNVGAKASTYSAQASFQPALCPLPSTAAKQPPPPPTLTSLSITQPHPHFANGVLSNTDAPPAQFNQPMSLFPSDLLTPLLLRPSHSAAASTDALPSIECDSEEATGGNGDKEEVKLRDAPKKAPVAGPDSKDGNESDDSVKMMEPSNLVVIDIDELDDETSRERVSNVLANKEPAQTSVLAEFSSASTQTAQQIEPERKVQQSVMAVKDSSITESVEEEKVSLGAFGNHTGPVHGLQIHDGLMYTCSGDNTARAYSLTTKECQTVFEGHTNKVNCLLVSSLPNVPTCLYTGSSDQTIRCYSVKSKKCLEQLSLTDRVLCLHIAWSVLYVGLANGSVVSFDLKTRKQLDVFECHGPRGVSCLAAAQEGARRVLLVGSYDTTISVRDAKSGLLLRSLEGHTKTVLCMKVVNDLVFSGSSDTSVRAHNIHTGELVRIYKGHGHAVTSIVILGKVMVTACLDKLVRVYELQSHDRLQVYGGHSDMVMCMAIHKSVIYTGCYDGSVCAVRLNLMKNYRCWWQNCTLIFGIVEHLVQHLVRDHSNPNLQTVRCRWKGCNRFFATQQSVRQELPDHMQSHVESDSQVQL